MSELVKQPDEKFCFECGEVIRAKAEICPKCGVRQPGFEIDRYRYEEPEKSRVASGVLALTLGCVGAHKFYLGEIGKGLAYLVFSWTLIPTVLGIVEGVGFLTMSDARFEDRYLD